MSKQTKSMQNDENYIVLNNPLRNPKFVRIIGKGKEVTVNETYTPKVFYEIVSRLKPEHLDGIKKNETIVFDLYIKDFLEEIGANSKNFKHLIQSVEALQTTLLKWKEGDDNISVAVVTKAIHNEKKGKIQLFIDSDLSRRILEVKDKENFSFLKSNVFRLQNAQAIRLYPFFKSWLNYCFNGETGKKQPYETELGRFKKQFGYDTSGYKRYAAFEKYVLKPATEEINEKTDLIVSYETVGENLDGLRPRVTGLMFRIVPKDQVIKKQLPSAEPQQQEAPLKEAVTAVLEDLKPTQPTASQPQTPQERATTPTEFTRLDKETTDTIRKINPQITVEQVNVLIETYGNIRLWEMAQGALVEHKKDPIKNIVGYFKTTSNMLGLGLFKQKEEKAKREVEKNAKEKAEQQAQEKLKNIIQQYDIESRQNFIQTFDNLATNKKEQYTRIVEQKMSFAKHHYFTGLELNDNGKSVAGQYILFNETYDRKKQIVEYAKNYGLYLKITPETDTGFAIERIEAIPQVQPQEQSQATEPQTEPTTDQQEKIESHKKGLLDKFSNWFKN